MICFRGLTIKYEPNILYKCSDIFNKDIKDRINEFIDEDKDFNRKKIMIDRFKLMVNNIINLNESSVSENIYKKRNQLTILFTTYYSLKNVYEIVSNLSFLLK